MPLRLIGVATFIYFLALCVTPYGDVEEAMGDTSKIKPFVKRYRGQRATCLIILSALLTIYFRQERANPASLTLGAILFTSRVSLTYDDISEERFVMHVNAIGPQSYTVIMMLPGIIAQAMLLHEIFVTSSSVGFAVVITVSCYILLSVSVMAAVDLTQNGANQVELSLPVVNK